MKVEEEEETWVDTQEVDWVAFIKEEEEWVAKEHQESRLLDKTVHERTIYSNNWKECYEI